MNKSTLQQKFWLFIIINAVIWSLIPLLRISLPMDTQEAIVWGKYCLWGTTKHPPFSGWLAYPFWLLTSKWDGSMYLLSQLCIALGIVYIYRLAKQLLSADSAILATALQFGIIYYHFSSVEYNVNVVSLALWPMCTFYFWRAYTQNKWQDWLLFGALVGINLLNKYISGVLFLSLALFVAADKGILRLLKNIKVYMAALICVLIIAPHLWWLYQNNFEMWHYMAARSAAGKITSVWRHLLYPLKFFCAQILFCAAAWLTYMAFYYKNHYYKHSNESATKSFLRAVKNAFWLEVGKERRQSLFILITAVAPIALFMTISFVSGSALKSMWGFPCLYMFGIALFYFFPAEWNKSKQTRFLHIMMLWSALFTIVYTAQITLTKSERFQLNAPQLAKRLEQAWQQNMGEKPLKYVGADVWYADILALYGSHEIKPMIWLSPKNNPWFDINDFNASGALVVAEDAGKYEAMQNQYHADITPPQKMMLEFKNYFGKTKTKEIFYGFYLPQEMKNGNEK